MAGIEVRFQLLPELGIVCFALPQPLDDRRGQGVGKTKGDGLDQIGVVEMRQITASVPVFCRRDAGAPENRFAPNKPGRDLDHGLVDGHRHRIEVGGLAFQPKSLGFQRKGDFDEFPGGFEEVMG